MSGRPYNTGGVTLPGVSGTDVFPCQVLEFFASTQRHFGDSNMRSIHVSRMCYSHSPEVPGLLCADAPWAAMEFSACGFMAGAKESKHLRFGIYGVTDVQPVCSLWEDMSPSFNKVIGVGRQFG